MGTAARALLLLMLAGIAEKAKELGIREFDEKQTRNLAPVRAAGEPPDSTLP